MSAYLERAADAAAYADNLRAELQDLARLLNRYRGASGLELLRDRSHTSQCQLEAIATRLGALGGAADPGRYPLSETEHAALDGARTLRERLVESLARYQRAENRVIDLKRS